MTEGYSTTKPEGTTHLYRSLVQRLQEASSHIKVLSNVGDIKYLQQMVEIQNELVSRYSQFSSQERCSLDMLMRWAEYYYRSCWSLYHSIESAKVGKDLDKLFSKKIKRMVRVNRKK